MRLPDRVWTAALAGALGLANAGCFGGDDTLVDRYGGGPVPLQPSLRLQSPLVAASAVIPSPVDDAQPQVRIAALVGSTPIYASEVEQATAHRIVEIMQEPESRRAQRRAEIEAEELRRLIERELILADLQQTFQDRQEVMRELNDAAGKEADKRFEVFIQDQKLKDLRELEALMDQQGFSLKGMRRQIERGFLMTQYIRNLVHPRVSYVSLGEVRAYYDAHPDEFQAEDRLQWQDLFVRADKFPSREEARAFAEQLVEKARAGEDFAELVKEHDQGDSVLRDGFGIGEKPGEIRPVEVEATVLSLREGEVGPLVEMAAGFHIVRVSLRQYAGRKPFNAETQNEIRELIRGEMAQREVLRLLGELRRRYPVMVFEE